VLEEAVTFTEPGGVGPVRAQFRIPGDRNWDLGDDRMRTPLQVDKATVQMLLFAVLIDAALED